MNDRVDQGRRGLILGAAALAAAPNALLAKPTKTPDGPVIAATRYGRLQGVAANGVASFKGVPYGAPTGGENRFLPPKPPVPWKDVRQAVDWGPTAPQRLIARYPVLESWDGDFDAAPKSEDCLVLNIFTPGIDSERRPVMLYLHGGGFTGRSGSRGVFDGSELARRHNVVVVTINHRLNIFGYGYFGHLDPIFADSGNVGTLDTIASLTWVRENISAFGGDKSNVTVFGQSGGGHKINILLASRAARGLFHKAIVQSGSYLRGSSVEDAQRSGDAFLKAAGIAPKDVRQIQKLSWQDIVAILSTAGGAAYADRRYQPVIDGRTLPDGPWYPDAPALSSDVPLMIGTTATETTMLLGSNDPTAFSIDESELRRRLAPWLDGADTEAVIAGFRRANPTATPSDLYFAITTTVRFRRPADFQARQRLGQKNGAPVYMYEIEWKTPVDGGKWGAPHSMDHGFVFHNLTGGDSMYGHATDLATIADQMSPAWAAFARSGNPNHSRLPHWPAYDIINAPTMMFDVDSHVVRNPRQYELAAVAAVPVVPQAGDPLTRVLR